jgi:osmotically-inducible protein OsmY
MKMPPAAHDDRSEASMYFAWGAFTCRPKRATVLAILLAVLGSFSLSACSPLGVAVGAGAATATAAQKEKGLETSLDDTQIELAVGKRLLERNKEIFWDVNTEVEEGRVLLTGSVKTVEHRLEAVKTVWQVDGVREVINEIHVGDQDSVQNYARDAWISTQLETKLLFDRDVSSIDYSIETVDQVVYLMGIAHSPEEIERVIGHAKEIAYVRRVISHVRVLAPKPKPVAAGS